MFNPIQFYEFGKQRKVFESTWKTDNTSAGSSTSTQVKLPLFSGGAYAMNVNWGDGTSSTITAWNQAAVTHTYSIAGTYTIKITGTCIGWQFNNGGDRLKILSVVTWGGLKLGNAGSYFYGCSNLNLSAVTDTLDLTGTTSLANAFFLCTSLTSINKISEWNTSAVTTVNSIFRGNPSFNQNLGNWNVSNILDFQNMFVSCSSFNNGGSSDINNWVLNNTSNILMSSMFFGASSFNQPLGNWNTIKVFAAQQMFTNATSFNKSLSTWDLSNLSSSNLMFQGASSFNNGLASGVAGNMIWNLSNLSDAGSMFINATSFNQNLGVLNLPSCSNFTNMFQGATKFNNGGSTDIGSWTLKTTGSVVMAGMFQSASIFNQPLNGWNTSVVTSMGNMFNSATAFNNGLASGVAGNMLWNLGNVTTTQSMFQSATSFNQNLGILSLSNCANFTSMFNNATKFNNGGSIDISSWVLKTTGTVNLDFMFRGASVFNKPLNGWNTIAVNSISNTFSTAVAFNNGLASGVSGVFTWDTSNIGNMAVCFNGASSFNQDISSWNISKVGDFNFMFASATKFNNGGSSGINSWVLRTVGATNMSSMFKGASVFNQPLNGWLVSVVTNMLDMFNGATLFNQDLGSWNVSNVTNLTGFMGSKTPSTFSTANLDAIYNTTTGWASRPVQPNIVITFGTAKYTVAGQAGRDILDFAPNNWTITDGGI